MCFFLAFAVWFHLEDSNVDVAFVELEQQELGWPEIGVRITTPHPVFIVCNDERFQPGFWNTSKIINMAVDLFPDTLILRVGLRAEYASDIKKSTFGPATVLVSFFLSVFFAGSQPKLCMV
jgi:hypothetical protein